VGTTQIQNTAVSRSKSTFCLSSPQSDEALIKAVASGDRSAMRTLYDRHNMRLYRFILRMVPDAGRAEDLVSEVFIDVWNQAGRFEGRSQVSTWILSIAHFKALTARALRPRRQDAAGAARQACPRLRTHGHSAARLARLCQTARLRSRTPRPFAEVTSFFQTKP
jgi:RNA polymerase sigma factor (sigma-70 family)